jgi:porin
MTNMPQLPRVITARLGLVLLGCLTVAAAGGPERDSVPTDPPGAVHRDTDSSPLMNFLTRDYLLGDWGGLRSTLSRHGVDFEFLYLASMPWNLSGGIQPGGVYEGGLLMALDLDSKRLLNYEGGTLHAGSLWLHGEDHFSDNHIGDLNKVNLIDFPNAFRLWELWYEQKFLDNRVSLRLGQMVVDRDFIVPEFYNSIASVTFLNQTFFYPTMAFNVWDVPGFPPGHHGLASTPYGAPGVRLRVDPTDWLYVQAGVYDGLPDTRSPGTRVNLNEDEGALIYFEFGIRMNQGTNDTGLPGNLKLGGYYHTDDFVDNYAYITTGSPSYHSGNYGAYFLADQVLYREVGKDDPAGQGLVGFFRFAVAPPDRNLAQFGVDGGLVYKGLIPKRDYDTFGIAWSYLEMSHDISQGQRDVNAFFPGYFPAIADYEAVVEANYRAQLSAWWALEASVQRPMHPGGSAAIRDAWVFILMSTLRF